MYKNMLYNFIKTVDTSSLDNSRGSGSFFDSNEILKPTKSSSVNDLFEYYRLDILKEYVKNSSTIKIKSTYYNDLDEEIKISTSTSSIFSSSDEEKLTRHLIEEKFENVLISYLEKNEIELGNFTEADKFLNQQIDKFGDVARVMINKFYTKLQDKEDLLCSFLILISRLNPSKITEIGHTIAMSALNHRSSEVRENSIRIFENFSDKTSLDFLVNSKNDADWIQDYKNDVIHDIRKQLKIL